MCPHSPLIALWCDIFRAAAAANLNSKFKVRISLVFAQFFFRLSVKKMMIASTGKVNYFKLVLCSILIHMSCAIFYLLCNALHSFHFNPLRIFRFTYYFFFNFFLQAPKENWLSYHFLIKNSLTYCELHTL